MTDTDDRRDLRQRILLLDLQHCLIENARELPWPATAAGVQRERYRHWLVDLALTRQTVLITVRSAALEGVTLEHIRLETGWSPDLACFNPHEFMTAPVWKHRALRDKVYPAYGSHPGQYWAIESNAKTREMYAREGIEAVHWKDVDPNAPRQGMLL